MQISMNVTSTVTTAIRAAVTSLAGGSCVVATQDLSWKVMTRHAQVRTLVAETSTESAGSVQLYYGCYQLGYR